MFQITPRQSLPELPVHLYPKAFENEVGIFIMFLSRLNREMARSDGNPQPIGECHPRLVGRCIDVIRFSNYEDLVKPQITAGYIELVDPTEIQTAQPQTILNLRLTSSGASRLIELALQNIIPPNYTFGDMQLKPKE